MGEVMLLPFAYRRVGEEGGRGLSYCSQGHHQLDSSQVLTDGHTWRWLGPFPCAWAGSNLLIPVPLNLFCHLQKWQLKAEEEGVRS